MDKNTPLSSWIHTACLSIFGMKNTFRRIAAAGSVALATTLAATLASPAGAVPLANGYTPSPERGTCFNLCGDAWGLGFDLFAVAPRHKIWLDNGGRTGGLTAGSAQNALEGAGVNGPLTTALGALGFANNAQNFFGSPEEVAKAFQDELAALAKSKGLTDEQVAGMRKELGTWGNFVLGGKIYGLTDEQAKKFGELRPLFLDRVQYAGTQRALRELFAALDNLKSGKDLTWGPIAAGSSLPGGPIGGTNGFHPADDIGGLAGGSSGLASGSS